MLRTRARRRVILRHKLGERYLRVDTEQSKEQEHDLGLDVATEAAQRTIHGPAAARPVLEGTSAVIERRDPVFTGR